MKITIGVFAHVDAGKTTFCECLLYKTNMLGTPGRVDHGNALMDHNEIEKRRGITIFSDIASFAHDEQEYYLIDTPGHIDFSAEAERAISVLDAAVLLISGVDGVQSHTVTICRMLKAKGIPVYIFINKTDQAGADVPACLNDIKTKLQINSCLLNSADDLCSGMFAEWLCDYDDELMHRYLDDKADAAFIRECTIRNIQQGNISLAFKGSALRQTGVLEILGAIGKTHRCHETQQPDFAARVYKVIHDKKGTQVTFIKCLGGCLNIRNEIAYGGGHLEKVNEMRNYQGKSYTNVNTAHAGDIVGVTGLTCAVPGMGLGKCDDIPTPLLRPALRASVLLNGNPFDAAMNCLRKLEAQDPLLEINYEPGTQRINICVMGKIQLEVLKDLVKDRHNLDLDFEDMQVVYRETVTEPVMGYGHFEPLRHYAEVHLRLEPNPDMGLDFSSEVHVNQLAKQHQNLIRHHLMERDHKGILTGSTLDNVCFVLTNGAVHEKHTHGGDLREAAYRAVRQGLEKAESVLLEPYYEFTIDVDSSAVGRVISDITKLHGTFEPPVISGERSSIKGAGPVATFLNYPEEILSFTKGTGAISLSFLGYLPCHNAVQIIERIGYQKDRDIENTSSSVFCAKGAGFEVKWHEAERYMHLL